MDHRFSPEDLNRLLGIAASISAHRGCHASEAITFIEHAVAGKDPPRRRRTVGEFAGRLLHLRGRRNRMLGAELMRDPAWDIMLGLVSADEEQRQTCTKMLCHDANLPTTTALRHLDRMEAEQLIERHAHRDDNRQTLVSLTEDRAAEVRDMVALFRDELS